MKCPGWLKRILRALRLTAKEELVNEALKGMMKEDKK